jgi:hypothetical protein
MTLKEKFKQWLDTNPRKEIREAQLEVIAEKWFKEIGGEASFMKAIEFGTKWQQEQDKNKYSEEEVYSIIRMSLGMKESGKTDIEIMEQLEQFKKEKGL